MLPQVRELADRFPRALVVVGVHSGKFAAERETARLAAACARLGVAHPVVNDRQLRVWRAWAVRGWPTLALVDERGYVAATWTGERTADQLAPTIAAALDRGRAAGTLALDGRWFDGALAAAESALACRQAAGSPALHGPERVALLAPDGAGARRLAIADTGHGRVLVGRLAAGGDRLTVERVVDRDAGLVAPQGLVAGRGRHAGTLFVADAGGHAVRAVDLASGAVRTLAGTGARVRSAADRVAGALASPWDLVWVDAGPAGAPTLVVAMAGAHALWTVDPDGAGAAPLAGGRGEGLVDGAAAEALLAQPMGLATDGATLWWADAESSAVRAAPLVGGRAGAVRTLVGVGLFDSGRVDGVGDAARLQHPEGLARDAATGRLVVADTYNGALRWLEPATRALSTWVDGLAEPTGVALDRDRVWIAESHADRVTVLDRATGARAPLVLD